MSRRSSSVHPDPNFQILEEIAASPDVSQRSLASRLGIALGLTNSLVRGLIRRGWVRATGIKRNRVRYLLTPAGIVEKARLSQLAFQHSVERYRLARVRVQQAFARLSAEEWPGQAPGSKHIMFYGTGELAEIGFICLQETDLQLVGVIDDQGRDRFFGVPVYRVGDLPSRVVDGGTGIRILVMSLSHTDKIRSELSALGRSGEQAVWI